MAFSLFKKEVKPKIYALIANYKSIRKICLVPEYTLEDARVKATENCIEDYEGKDSPLQETDIKFEDWWTCKDFEEILNDFTAEKQALENLRK